VLPSLAVGWTGQEAPGILNYLTMNPLHLFTPQGRGALESTGDGDSSYGGGVKVYKKHKSGGEGGSGEAKVRCFEFRFAGATHSRALALAGRLPVVRAGHALAPPPRSGITKRSLRRRWKRGPQVVQEVSATRPERLFFPLPCSQAMGGSRLPPKPPRSVTKKTGLDSLA